jgi:hypothetical protein
LGFVHAYCEPHVTNGRLKKVFKYLKPKFFYSIPLNVVKIYYMKMSFFCFL